MFLLSNERIEVTNKFFLKDSKHALLSIILKYMNIHLINNMNFKFNNFIFDFLAGIKLNKKFRILNKTSNV